MEFKTKDELIAHIRGRVKQMVGKTGDSSYQGDVDSPMNVMLARFPQLRQTLEKLLTMQFRIFVNDIQWVAPKPTTFKIILPNGQYFTLIWNTEDLIVSFDGASIYILDKPKRENNTWFHVDQSYTRNNFECIQSWINAYDTNEGDATLVILENSNQYHKDFQEHFNITDKKDWFKLVPLFECP